jgi:fatty-acyl-CoA synthase
MEIVRKTLSQSLDEVFHRYPDNEALVHTDLAVRYTYDLLSWEVERAARGLCRLGVKKGDRVVLWAGNVPEWIVAQLALIRIGALFVPVDPAADQEDLRFILDECETKTVILTRGQEENEQLELLQGARAGLPLLENIILFSAESHPDAMLWFELLAMGDGADTDTLKERESGVRPEDPVAIMYTSGTTGPPKGVLLDHLGLLNKCLFSASRQGLTPADRLCLFFPLFHMFGNTCITLAGLLSGAALVIPSPFFDPDKVLKAIYKERCSAIYGSPGMIVGLLGHPNFNKKRWKTVSKGILGGAAPTSGLMKRLIQGVGVSRIGVGYGMTEASSWISMTHPDDPFEKKVSTMGTVLECNQVKFVDPASGEDLPAGAPGELCVKGFLMKSYYRRPEATRNAIDREGWFHSGDLGVMDVEGYVRITGRIKDLIVKDGVEIHPAEVEEIVHQLDGVAEVQVFGFAHPETGQEIAGWIKPEPGTNLRIQDVLAFLQARMDGRKIPKYWKFVSEYPTSRLGKVLKSRLAEMAREEYGGS